MAFTKTRFLLLLSRPQPPILSMRSAIVRPLSSVYNRNVAPEETEAKDILETHMIPGKYLHFIKESRRSLKKEARRARYQSVQRIVPRKLRTEFEFPLNTRNENNPESITDGKKDDSLSLNANFKSDDEIPLATSSTPDKDLQENIVMIPTREQISVSQRVARALRNCYISLPHHYLSPSYMKVCKITVSNDLRKAQIYWRPVADQDVSVADIDHIVRQYSSQLRTLIRRQIRVRRPPKLMFIREDLAFGNIELILRQLQREFKRPASPFFEDKSSNHGRES